MPNTGVMLQLSWKAHFLFCSFAGSLKYPLSKDGHEPEPRTNDTFQRDKERSQKSGEPSNCIKDISLLARLLGFDLVWTVCPDYTHNVLEGAAKHLANIWFGSSGSQKMYGNWITGSPMQSHTADSREWREALKKDACERQANGSGGSFPTLADAWMASCHVRIEVTCAW